MSPLKILLIVLLVMLLLGGIPAWPYIVGWGPGPISAAGLLLIVLIVLVLLRM